MQANSGPKFMGAMPLSQFHILSCMLTICKQIKSKELDYD